MEGQAVCGSGDSVSFGVGRADTCQFWEISWKKEVVFKASVRWKVIIKDAGVAATAPPLLLVSPPRQALPMKWQESGHFLLPDVGIDKSTWASRLLILAPVQLACSYSPHRSLSTITERKENKVKLPGHVWLFSILRTICQAPPSMEFSRLEYWSELPFPSPGDLPNPGIETGSPALQAESYCLSHQLRVIATLKEDYVY